MLIRLIILGLLLLPVQSWAAIAVDTQAVGSASFGSVTDTQSWTVNNASPLVLSVMFTGNSFLSFTWNGVAADVTQYVAGSGPYQTAIGIWKNPATGTHNAVATFTGATDAIMFMVSTTGGDTTTGYRTRYTQNDSVTGPNTNLLSVVDSQNGDLVVLSVAAHLTTIAAVSGQTVGSAISNNLGGNTISGFLSTEPATGANTTGGTTVDANAYGEVAVALIPSGGGGGATPHNLMLMGVGP